MGASEFDSLVLQAEAYEGNTYVLIRNGRTENIVELTKRIEPVREVPNFPAFLEETREMIRGARVLIALGDSRTANFANWARIVALDYLRNTDVVVVNLADWARCSEDHVFPLEYYLGWLRDHRASGTFVAFFGCLSDMYWKLFHYTDFMNGAHPIHLPQTEEQLVRHRYGRVLANLTDEIPTEWDDVYRWIARRILAGVKLLDRLCDDANSEFFAILEPTTYADYAPGYVRALRRAYEAQATSPTNFETWCQERGYSRDPSAALGQNLRVILEHLRDFWLAQQSRSTHGRYIDWTRLFCNIDECCFQKKFDAIHYNQLGTNLIAKSMLDLLPVG